jgi:hypothetical protein
MAAGEPLSSCGSILEEAEDERGALLEMMVQVGKRVETSDWLAPKS